MIRRLVVAAALAALSPLLAAQEVDHSTMDHSRMDHAKPVVAQPAPPLPPPPPQAMDEAPETDHAAMGHSTMDHSAMDHAPAPAAPTDAPRTPIPPITEADRVAARPPSGGHATHGDSIHTYVAFDRLERWSSDQGDGLAWEVHGWSGTDLNRLWFRSEGEAGEGESTHHEVELLYGRSVSPWWDVVVGLQHQAQPIARDALAVGVVGLAPYKIETQAMLYLRDGAATARLELEYDTLLDANWILQSQLELLAESRGDAARGVGAGFSQAEFGLRLRYEKHRQFAPYLGVVREQRLAATADLARAHGETSGDWRWVIGLRAWF